MFVIYSTEYAGRIAVFSDGAWKYISLASVGRVASLGDQSMERANSSSNAVL